MKQLTTVVGIGLVIAACQPHHTLPSKPQHRRLLGFKSEYVAEPGDDKFVKLKLAKKLQSGRIQVVPFRDILYISLLRDANACGRYKGNISIGHDTIYLHYGLASDTVCASSRVDRLTYLVDNPERRRYKVRISNL